MKTLEWYAESFTLEVRAMLPRMTLAEFEGVRGASYRDLAQPCIITDAWNAAPSWEANYSWSQSLLMLGGIAEVGSSLMPLSLATRTLSSVPGTYMLYQLTPSRWNALEDTEVAPRRLLGADHWLDERWPERCLDASQAAEFHQKTHWAQLAAGMSARAGMSNHTDALFAGSWHAQLAGKKSWRLCGTSIGSPCFEDVVAAGEVLLYGASWSHETRCVDVPTVSITRSILQRGFATAFVEQVMNDCASTPSRGTDLRFSGSLCDAFAERCAPHILDAAGVTAPLPRRGWRDLVREHSAAKASTTGIKSAGGMVARRTIAKREAVLPAHYTYDTHEALALPLNRDYYEGLGHRIIKEAHQGHGAGSWDCTQ